MEEFEIKCKFNEPEHSVYGTKFAHSFSIEGDLDMCFLEHYTEAPLTALEALDVLEKFITEARKVLPEGSKT